MERKIVDYTMVYATNDTRGFIGVVREYLKGGWEIYGDIHIAYVTLDDGSYNTELKQVMVVYE